MINENCDLILVAGGMGTRFDGLKQFSSVCGKPVYQWSLLTFLNWPHAGRAVIVVPEASVETVRAQLLGLDLTDRVDAVSGGKTRFHSAARGFAKLQGKVPGTFPGNTLPEKPTGTWVMVHDAARPCLSAALMDRLWEARGADLLNENFAGVIPGLPVQGRGIPSGRVCGLSESLVAHPTLAHTFTQTLDGHTQYSIQTPQLFKKRHLEAAYAEEVNAGVPDDSSLLEKRGLKVIVVPGEYDNLKITFREDIARVSDWLRQRHT